MARSSAGRLAHAVAAVLVLFLFGLGITSPGFAEHGLGVPVGQYRPRNADEAAIVALIRTVGAGWEQRAPDQILSAYAREATQRAWDDPARSIDRAGIRAEAEGAFRDPGLGAVRFRDRIHRITIVNATAAVEINQSFYGWGTEFLYRDLWVFLKRQGRWELIRYDYEPRPGSW